MTKYCFLKIIKLEINKKVENKNSFDINIKSILQNNIIDFDIDFKKDIFDDLELYGFKISLIFEDTVFNGKVEFKDLTLETLELQDVIFKKSVAIKNNKINTLILRPYEIHANIVYNNGYYAKDGLVKEPNQEIVHTSKIQFEDPHICEAKVFFIGISKDCECDFTNRNLQNVVFQNCNFKKTYFLNSFLKEAKFMNCEFPIIEDNYEVYAKGNKFYWVIGFLLLIYSILDMRDEVWLNGFFNYFDNWIVIYIIYIPIWLVSFIFLMYTGINYLFNKIFLIDGMLMFKHIGISDEKLNKNKMTTLNIKNIYDDLKYNFINNGNPQYAGDFYYSSSLLKIQRNEKFIEMIILQGSFLINGFGERALKPLMWIITLIIFIMLMLNPNSDYISTPSTPLFLLDVKTESNYELKKNTTTYSEYNSNSFMILSKMDIHNNKTYAFDNRYDFK